MSAFGDTFINNIVGQGLQSGETEPPEEVTSQETGLPEGVTSEEVKGLFEMMEKGVDREMERAEAVKDGDDEFVAADGVNLPDESGMKRMLLSRTPTPAKVFIEAAEVAVAVVKSTKIAEPGDYFRKGMANTLGRADSERHNI